MGQRIGLIAGSGPFPLIFSEKAREKGYQVYAVGYHNETDPALADRVEALEIIYIGQIKRLIKFFKRHQVTDAVMIGAIKKPGAISDIRPDIKAISLYAGMRKNSHDDRVLRLFAKALEEEGVYIRPSTFLLPELLAQEGCWTKRIPTKDEQPDIELGWRMAKAIGKLDIGQCVVVAIDAKRVVEGMEPAGDAGPRWTVTISGGRVPTDLDAIAWAEEAVAAGAGEVLLTSMDADGTLGGYDVALTRAVAEAVPVPVIASGGAGCPEHFVEALTEGRADAALAASLFHDRMLSIGEVKAHLAARDVPVRITDDLG